MFFWQQDGRETAESHLESFKSVVIQLAGHSVRKIGAFQVLAHQSSPKKLAATQISCPGSLYSSRCDLMTEMVGEFPDMQGIMGRYQAGRDGEAEELVQSVEEFYMPDFPVINWPRAVRV